LVFTWRPADLGRTTCVATGGHEDRPIRNPIGNPFHSSLSLILTISLVKIPETRKWDQHGGHLFILGTAANGDRTTRASVGWQEMLRIISYRVTICNKTSPVPSSLSVSWVVQYTTPEIFENDNWVFPEEFLRELAAAQVRHIQELAGEPKRVWGIANSAMITWFELCLRIWVP